MYGATNNQDTSSPWLVRAEVTIRHANETGNLPGGSSPSGEGLRMVYKWSQDPRSTPSVQRNDDTPVGSYGFQRGNILFTSTPPPRSSSYRPSTIPRYMAAGTPGSTPSSSQNLGINVSDSGYNSEQFSPQSYSSLPIRRPSQPYNRRCKSTCSIVLSAAGTPVNNEGDCFGQSSSFETVSRIQCADPWCYHAATPSGKFGHFINAVPEACEDCVEGITSGIKAFTTHFCTRVPGKNNNGKKILVNSRDAASQTNDVEPLIEKQLYGHSSQFTNTKAYESRRKTAPGLLKRFDQLRESTRKLSREEIPSVSSAQSSTHEKSNFQGLEEAADSSGKDDPSKRKSRTVHIDVYCTGSEEEADDSSYSDSSDSSGQEKKENKFTVFESDAVKVTHSRAQENRLPRGLQDDKAFLKRSAESQCESFKQGPMRMPSLASSKGYETDDVLSSLYPSQFSSYSAIRDLDSAPWSAASSCAGIGQDPYDSAAATSWKDTFSDIESLLNSRASLTPCDSFEYANSSDRERINKLEKSWGEGEDAQEKKSKTWRSPQVERRQLLQHRKMKEFLDKHQVGWSSPESHQDSDDSAEIGWSFVSPDDNSRGVRRDSTVRRASKEQTILDDGLKKPASSKEPEDRGCMSDGASHPSVHSLRKGINLFGNNSSSPSQERVESRVTSPFTLPQGEKTDHLLKASRFGAIVGAFRKPGHHVGPAKNPSCACEHCRRFFEEDGPRGRSRSVGDMERRPGPWIRRAKDIISRAPQNSKNNVS